MLQYRTVSRGRQGTLDSAMPRFPSQQLFILGMAILDPGIHALAAKRQPRCVASGPGQIADARIKF